MVFQFLVVILVVNSKLFQNDNQVHYYVVKLTKIKFKYNYTIIIKNWKFSSVKYM